MRRRLQVDILWPQIERFLRQPVHERSDPLQTDQRLLELGSSLASELEQASGEIPAAEEVPPELAASASGAIASAGAGADAVDFDTARGPAIPALGLGI